MPLSTGQLAAGKAIAHIKYMDDEVIVHYLPGKLSKKEMSGITTGVIAAGQDTIDENAKIICNVVTWWDVVEPKVDDKGAPVLDEQQQPVMTMFPLEWQRVANELPVPFIGHIMKHITNESMVGEANGASPSKR